MKKLLIIYLFLTFKVFAEPYVIPFNNVDIKVFNKSKVQVFKGDVHMFGIDCKNGIFCKAFVSHASNPDYKIFDGVVQPNVEVLELFVENVQSVVEKRRNLVFIMSSGSASGSYSNIQEFSIDTDTGAFYHVTKEYDWMRYGHPRDYPLKD